MVFGALPFNKLTLTKLLLPTTLLLLLLTLLLLLLLIVFDVGVDNDIDDESDDGGCGFDEICSCAYCVKVIVDDDDDDDEEHDDDVDTSEIGVLRVNLGDVCGLCIIFSPRVNVKLLLSA
jgi:hypothetical protein